MLLIRYNGKFKKGILNRGVHLGVQFKREGFSFPRLDVSSLKGDRYYVRKLLVKSVSQRRERTHGADKQSEIIGKSNDTHTVQF